MGKLWVWGYGADLGLGVSGAAYVQSPTQIGVADNWTKLSACNGNLHFLAINNVGELWGWGSNSWQELGVLGAKSSPILLSAGPWVSAVAGYSQSAAVKADGTLWTCGNGGFGPLGHGNYNDLTVFTQVGSATDWVRVHAGYQNTFAINAVGELWVTGYNGNGNLGLGHTSNINTLTRVTGIPPVARLSSKSNQTLIVGTDGTLWTWGKNNLFNQLARGVIGTIYPTPERVGTDTDWLDVAAGGRHSLFLKTNSTLWGVGGGAFGQLDRGVNTDLTVLTQIGTDTDWESVWGAYYGTFARRVGSTFLCACGAADMYRLGTGDTTNRNVFTDITQVQYPAGMMFGASACCAIDGVAPPVVIPPLTIDLTLTLYTSGNLYAPTLPINLTNLHDRSVAPRLPITLGVYAVVTPNLPITLEYLPGVLLAPILPLRVLVYDHTFSAPSGLAAYAYSCGAGVGSGVEEEEGLTATVGADDVSDQLTGEIVVEISEGADRICTFTRRADEVPDVLALIGQQVSVSWNGSGLFSGQIETPRYDARSGLIYCTAVDRISRRWPSLPNGQIEALTAGAQWSALIYEPDSMGMEYLNQRLETLPASLDMDASGRLVLTPWSAPATRSYSSGSVRDGSLSIEYARGDRLVDRVEITLRYRYPLLQEAVARADYHAPPGKVAYPTRASVREALERTGWTPKLLSVNGATFGSWTADAGIQWGGPSASDSAIVTDATAILRKRFVKMVTETYRLTVTHGAGGYPAAESFNLEVDFQASDWAQDPTLKPVFATPVYGLTRVALDTQAYDGRPAVLQALRCLRERARVRIKAAHRTVRGSFAVDLDPSLELSDIAHLSHPGGEVTGKLNSIRHSIPVDGSAADPISEGTLIGYMPAGGSDQMPDPPSPPDLPPPELDPDDLMLALGNQIYARHVFSVEGTPADYGQDGFIWEGYAVVDSITCSKDGNGNCIPGSERVKSLHYEVTGAQFALTVPEIPAADRDPYDRPEVKYTAGVAIP